jgi:hypothetical protein
MAKIHEEKIDARELKEKKILKIELDFNWRF